MAGKRGKSGRMQTGTFLVVATLHKKAKSYMHNKRRQVGPRIMRS